MIRCCGLSVGKCLVSKCLHALRMDGRNEMEKIAPVRSSKSLFKLQTFEGSPGLLKAILYEFLQIGTLVISQWSLGPNIKGFLKLRLPHHPIITSIYNMCTLKQ